MILASVIAALRSWGAPALAAVLAVALVGDCQARRATGAALAAERARGAEADRLRARGQELVEQAQDLRSRVATLEKDNADLRTAVEAAKRVAPDAKPVSTVHASTGPVPVEASEHVQAPGGHAPAPRRAPPPGPLDEGGAVSAQAGGPLPPVPARCVLDGADHGEVRVDVVGLETKAGNRIIAGAASAWRLRAGEPDLRLFGGPFSSALTEAAEKAPPPPALPSWGAGPWFGAGSQGLAVGAVVAAPQARLLGLGFELSLGAGITPTGRAMGSAQVVIRPGG